MFIFNKENRIKNKYIRKILKIILWVIGIFVVVFIMVCIRVSWIFSRGYRDNNILKFFRKIADPCYEIYDGFDTIGRPNYTIKNGRVCIFMEDGSGWGDGGVLKSISVQGADPNTFVDLNCHGYSKDKNNVYYITQKIQGADPNTFEILDSWYTKDKNNVYYKDKKIQDADIATFKVEIDSYAEAIDKNHKYFLGKIQ